MRRCFYDAKQEAHGPVMAMSVNALRTARDRADCSPADLDSQLLSMKLLRRRLRVEISAYENRLAALYTEVDRLAAALDHFSAEGAGPIRQSGYRDRASEGLDTVHNNQNPSGDSPSGERAVNRRLTDKIGDAFAHSVWQGRKMVADKLRQIHESVVAEETEAGRRRADDALEK